MMKTLEASAATDGVSLIKAAERLVKGGRPALKELKCARLTLLEFGAGRGEVEAICNVVVHCRDVSAASLGSTVAARRLVWKVRRISKRGRCQKLDVLGVTNRAAPKKSTWVRRKSEELNECHELGESNPIKIDECDNFADPQTKYLTTKAWLQHLHYTHNMPGEPPPVHTKVKKKVVAIDETKTD